MVQVFSEGKKVDGKHNFKMVSGRRSHIIGFSAVIEGHGGKIKMGTVVLCLKQV